MYEVNILYIYIYIYIHTYIHLPLSLSLSLPIYIYIYVYHYMYIGKRLSDAGLALRVTSPVEPNEGGSTHRPTEKVREGHHRAQQGAFGVQARGGQHALLLIHPST